ncbi:MAG: hypothetical protein HFI55_02260 [Lachnospiraceae bacterium]|nr:hypothetical protein [Lachnospiraceae bacterium]
MGLNPPSDMWLVPEKGAGLYHAYEDGVTLYIQWLWLFRCYQGLKGRKQ